MQIKKYISKGITSLLLIMALGCFVWTCTKEEDPQGEDAIVGDWVLQDLTINGTETKIENGDTLFSIFNIQGINYRNTISFTVAPNQFTTRGNTIVRVRQTGNNIFQPLGNDTLSFFAGDSGTWSFENSRMIFNPTSPDPIGLDYAQINRNAFRLSGITNDTIVQLNSVTILESATEMIFRK